jgi:dTDP-4-amino-4,6-dideoxygalactose transaminase
MSKVDWPPHNDAILQAIRESFEAGNWWIYKGEAVRDFEQRFAKAHGCQFGVSVCNGTVALDVILRGLDIGPGDRVVLPAYNYYSLPKSVSNVGATPLFVDICDDNLTLDAEKLRAVLGSGVKAVVAVHISSSVAQVDAISALCEAAGVALIEDCAQAHGASYANRRVGCWGKAGLFSFGGIKLMTCGQGGIITTSDPVLYEKCYAIVNRGRIPGGGYNSHGIIGDNYQLSELAAVILRPQLETLDALSARRESMMQFLDQQISTIDGLRSLKQFDKTTCRAQMRYSCFYDPPTRRSITRDQLVNKALKAGIPLMPGYRAVSDDAGLFKKYATEGKYPLAQAAQNSVISIHHSDLLRAEEYWSAALEKLNAILASGGVRSSS